MARNRALTEFAPYSAAHLWARVQSLAGQPDDCWPWPWSKNASSYAAASIRSADLSKQLYMRVARFILLRRLRSLSSDIVARHTCDTPSCVNPRHIIAGTYQQNIQDCIDRGRRGVRPRPAACPHGHRYTVENTRINKKGAPVCRACDRARNVARRAQGRI